MLLQSRASTLFKLKLQPNSSFFKPRFYRLYTQDTQTLYENLIAGDRRSLSKAITLVESTRSDHRILSSQLVSLCVKYNNSKAKKAKRIGLTGTPGVGKSSFIEAFGKVLIEKGHKLAVLAVDPSSARSGGSILGDKTRMPFLSVCDNAYVRPSPNRGCMGGVTRNTLESIILTEAAGYDICFVETVGVGQSEFMVAEMVDMFILLAQPGSGDTLQGIKKGIMELVDLLVVNKSDGNLEEAAKKTLGNLIDALRFIAPKSYDWSPKALRVSSVTNYNLDRVYNNINLYFEKIEESGRWAQIRHTQQKTWMWREVNNLVMERLKHQPQVLDLANKLEEQVANGTLAPTSAAYQLVDVFLQQNN